ncbi:unnamed protein product [Callosobruchus maculatus]|uniref:Mitochondrial assembly of ribosomal large subunit protein 1 n=1 Tax=Callosobruchus maculatus TaxID=64391 RepID=A0A653CZN8_CALMS|nr:unnamed protein product [Callosobruchus maculatus]
MLATFRLARKFRVPRTGSFCKLQNHYETVVRLKNTRPETENVALGDAGVKYQQFKEENANEILDIYEERLKYIEEEVEEENPFEGLNLERGVTGVYDIEDLVEVLKQENAIDIFVAKVPDEIKYVNYICVVTGKSQRHMQALVQFVRRVYKQKRHETDLIPKTEGEMSKDWIAIDLGNIALHIFSPKARLYYDLDSLWAVGSQYDREYNKPEPISDMLESHTIYLRGLEPAK